MGIVRLAKSLRLLKSIKEYSSRESDIKEKISGNRVYMDFVSIVYRIQENVALELNYLLFSFILIKRKIINTDELLSEKLYNLLIKYKESIKDYKKIYAIMDDISDNTEKKEVLDKLLHYIDNSFINHFKTHIRSKKVLNTYIYRDVSFFIVDMLTQKITDVEYILIAFDGIPSFGKVQEQRQRRYMRFVFNEFKKIMGKKEDIKQKIPLFEARKEYDKDFIHVDIRTAIEHVYSMYHDNTLQNDISYGIDLFRKNNKNSMKKPVIEVIDRPYGEGEKILMDKLIIDHKKYGDNKTYVFYSPDGDSVLLCLNVYVKTKMKSLNVVKMYMLKPSKTHNNQSQYVDVPKLYENIVKHVVKYSHLDIKTDEEKDHICLDFIFLLNFYGNDFMHQIPTMEISTTILDLIYVYSRFIREHNYIVYIKNKKVHINFNSMKEFFIELAGFEEYLMLDSYTSDLESRSRIYRFFGDIFPFRYMLDYRDRVYEHKEHIYNIIKQKGQSYNSIKQMISDMITQLNEIQTKSGQKYGDIFIKTEAKNIGSYVSKIMTDPEQLLDNSYLFIYNIRLRRNRNEKHMTNMINEIEKDLIKHNRSIDINAVKTSNNKQIREFSFAYDNIRLIVPHEQMPTTSKDMDIFLLEWKSGKWMDIINSYHYELGFDWKKNKIKKVNHEMKRYQHNMLEVDNKGLELMIIDYLKTLSWMTDYYMNTNDNSTQKYISTWSYRHERSPFISHISNFLQNKTEKNIINIMLNVYNKSLVPTNKYLTEKTHKFYIYPLSKTTLSYLPTKYHDTFPDMLEYIKMTIKSASDYSKKGKRNRVFDCRMCAYLSKCIFKNKMMSYAELNAIKKNTIKRARIM